MASPKSVSLGPTCSIARTISNIHSGHLSLVRCVSASDGPVFSDRFTGRTGVLFGAVFLCNVRSVGRPLRDSRRSGEGGSGDAHVEPGDGGLGGEDCGRGVTCCSGEDGEDGGRGVTCCSGEGGLDGEKGVTRRSGECDVSDEDWRRVVAGCSGDDGSIGEPSLGSSRSCVDEVDLQPSQCAYSIRNYDLNDLLCSLSCSITSSFARLLPSYGLLRKQFQLHIFEHALVSNNIMPPLLFIE